MADKKPVPVPEDSPQVVNLSNTRVEKVEADMVRLRRSLVSTIESGEAEVHQSGVGQVTAEYTALQGSLAGVVQGGAVTMNGVGIGAVRSHEAVLTGSVGAMLADEASLIESRAGILAANSVTADRVRTVVLLAKRVEGPVETALDTRQVLIASLATGLVTGAVILLGQLLFGRHKR